MDESQAQAAREALREAGAESLDKAREIWWSDLRAAEEEAYRAEGKDFALDENLYRRGFEAALHPRARGLTFVQSSSFLREYFGADRQTDAFRHGYERGQIYQQKLLEKFPPS
jgi:hypothetical protein